MTEKRAKDIDGVAFTLTIPPVSVARRIYDRVKRVLVVYADNLEEGQILGGPVSAAYPGGSLSSEDIEFLIKEFGQLTVASKTVFAPTGEEVEDLLPLKDARMHDAAFADVSSQITWLDWCLEETFKATIAKTRAATQELKQRAEARAAAAAKGQPGQTT